MSRIQKSICDECGKEVMSAESFNVDGFTIRIGHDMANSFLHDMDFCSAECLAKATDKVISQLRKRLNEKKQQVNAKGKRK